MSKESNASSGGICVFGLLGIVFVVLKLLGITAVAEWSWWWVTLPFWFGIAMVLGILAIGAICAVLYEFLKK